MTPARSLACCLLLASLPACGTEPEVLAQTYLLSTLDDELPPRRVGTTPTCDVIVRGGTLFLDASDAFDLAINVYTDCRRSGGVITPTAYEYSGTVSIDGQELSLETADGAPGLIEGRISGSGTIQMPIGALVPNAGEDVRAAFVKERSPIGAL
jgi:hypothetical protein